MVCSKQVYVCGMSYIGLCLWFVIHRLICGLLYAGLCL